MTKRQMERKDFEVLADAVFKVLSEELKACENISPCLVGFKLNEQHEITHVDRHDLGYLFSMPRGKDIAAKIFDLGVESDHFDICAFISEAWVVHTDKSEPIPRSLENHPDRKEVAIAHFRTTDFQIFTMYPMNLADFTLEFQALNWESGVEMAGRFAGHNPVKH